MRENIIVEDETTTNRPFIMFQFVFFEIQELFFIGGGRWFHRSFANRRLSLLPLLF